MGCNLGSAGNGSLCDISDGLVALSEIGLYRRGFPTKSIGDVLDGKPGSSRSDGCRDSIGMRDEPFDVDTQVMCFVGVSAEASGSHDVLDIVSGDILKGTGVVTAEHADGIAGWNAECQGSS